MQTNFIMKKGNYDLISDKNLFVLGRLTGRHLSQKPPYLFDTAVEKVGKFSNNAVAKEYLVMHTCTDQLGASFTNHHNIHAQ